MRILTLCYEFPPVGGGGSKAAHGLARELVRQGHFVQLLTLGFRNQLASECVDGIHVRRVHGLRAHHDRTRAYELASYLMAVRRPLRALLRDGRYDVVHIHFLLPDGLLALLVPELRSLPLVMTAHGTDVPGFNPDRFRFMHRLLRPIWLRVTRAAGAIVCPSAYLQGLVQRAAPAARTLVIPNGIDPGGVRVDRPRTLTVLAVSRLVERKGLQNLIAALAHTTPALRAVIVGSGPYGDSLAAAAAPLGDRVAFRGWLDHHSTELRELYETCAIFVLPSRAENFPMVLLESMAAGQAIVTTDGTGCREVVGDAALLVRDGDIEQLAGVLDLLAADEALRTRLQRAARARLEQRYTWSSVARRYLALFEAQGAGVTSGAPLPDVTESARARLPDRR